jgi:hypothetical protein
MASGDGYSIDLYSDVQACTRLLDWRALGLRFERRTFDPVRVSNFSADQRCADVQVMEFQSIRLDFAFLHFGSSLFEVNLLMVPRESLLKIHPFGWGFKYMCEFPLRGKKEQKEFHQSKNVRPEYRSSVLFAQDDR